MKKLICFCLALLCLFSVCACKDDDPSPESPPVYEVKKQTSDVIFNGKDYGDISMLYLALDGLEEANELLLSIALRHRDMKLPNLSSYGEDDMPEVTYETEKISVTYLSADFISAKVEGTLTVSLAPHPEPFVYTVNIDLKNNREFPSADIVKDFDKIKELFRMERFELSYGDEKLVSETTLEDMIMQYHTEYEIYPYFYFTRDKLFMNIELVYTLGSNAGYSIPLSDVKEHLNDEITKIIK